MRTMNRVMVFAASALLIMSATVAQAAATSPKIGVMDLQTILQKSPQLTKITDDLKKQFKPRQEALVSIQKTLQAKMDKLNRNASTMSQKQRQELQKTIVNDKAKFSALQQNFQADLIEAKNKAMKDISDKINQAVKQVAARKKLDLVLQKGTVAYASDKVDITQDITDALKRQR